MSVLMILPSLSLGCCGGFGLGVRVRGSYAQYGIYIKQTSMVKGGGIKKMASWGKNKNQELGKKIKRGKKKGGKLH